MGKTRKRFRFFEAVLFQVVRASEELTYSVVNAIEHARCLQVLCPVVAAGDFPINQTAVKMLTKVQLEYKSPLKMLPPPLTPPWS